MLESTIKSPINPLIKKKYFLYLKKKNCSESLKVGTNDNIKFHMKEMRLRKMKLKFNSFN